MAKATEMASDPTYCNKRDVAKMRCFLGSKGDLFAHVSNQESQ